MSLIVIVDFCENCLFSIKWALELSALKAQLIPWFSVLAYLPFPVSNRHCAELYWHEHLDSLNIYTFTSINYTKEKQEINKFVREKKQGYKSDTKKWQFGKKKKKNLKKKTKCTHRQFLEGQEPQILLGFEVVSLDI